MKIEDLNLKKCLQRYPTRCNFAECNDDRYTSQSRLTEKMQVITVFVHKNS